MNQPVTEVKIEDITERGIVAQIFLDQLQLAGHFRRQTHVTINNFVAPGGHLSVDLGGYAVPRAPFSQRIYVIFNDRNDFSHVLKAMDRLSRFLLQRDRLVVINHHPTRQDFVGSTYLNYNFTQVKVNMLNMDSQYILRVFREVIFNDKRDLLGSQKFLGGQ